MSISQATLKLFAMHSLEEEEEGGGEKRKISSRDAFAREFLREYERELLGVTHATGVIVEKKKNKTMLRENQEDDDDEEKKKIMVAFQAILTPLDDS